MTETVEVKAYAYRGYLIIQNKPAGTDAFEVYARTPTRSWYYKHWLKVDERESLQAAKESVDAIET